MSLLAAGSSNSQTEPTHEGMNDMFDNDMSDDAELENEEELLTPREMDKSDNSNNEEEDIEMDGNDEEGLLTPTEDYMMMIESDDDDDNIAKDTVKDIQWGDLPKFITDLHTQIEDSRIPSVQVELSMLKRRFAAANMRKVREEFEQIADRGSELNTLIIRELHRNGVDLLNKALKRLLSKRERTSNEGKLSAVQKKLCRKTHVQLLDLNCANLHDAVRDVDAKVTSFQKQVEMEIRLVQESDNNMTDDEDEERTAERIIKQQQKKKRKPIVVKDLDCRHPHASRKRMSSFSSGVGASPRTSSKQNRQHAGQVTGTTKPKKQWQCNTGCNRAFDSYDECLEHERTCRGNGASKQRHNTGSKAITSLEEDDDQSTDSIDFGAVSNFDVDVDFVGDTDDIDDDNHTSVLPGGFSKNRGAQRKQLSNSTASRSASSRGGGGDRSSRKPRPMSEAMEGWLQKQGSDGEVELEQRAKRKQSSIRSSLNRQALKSRSRQNRQSAASAAGDKRGSSHIEQWVQEFCRPNKTSRSRPRVDATQPNNNARGNGSGPSRAKSSAVRGGAVPLDDGAKSCSRPTIPHELSADLLFDSLSTTPDANREEHLPQRSADARSLRELCQELQGCHPSNLQSCRNIIAALEKTVGSTSENELQKDEVIELFQALHVVLQRKCTNLLDIIRTNPEIASLQMDCWCIVFRMFENKLHCKLCQKDGIIYKVFGNKATLASLLLIQVIDALYSQLLWEEYGLTQTFHVRLFDQLRSLCIRIGVVIPLFPTVCDLIVNRFTKPTWQISLSIEKENKPFFHPEMHIRFITFGEVMVDPNKGDIWLRSYKKQIPREIIEAIWAIMGFTSSCSRMALSKSDPDKNLMLLLSALMSYDCGTLADNDQQLPPPKLQVETCSREVKWICSLLSSKMLGELPRMDKFVKLIIQRAVALESFDLVLKALPALSSSSSINKAVKQLWEYSCIVDADDVLESNLQAGLMNTESFFLDNSNINNDVYCLLPSSDLLNRCVAFATRYSNIIMKKKIPWETFRDEYLYKLVSLFMRKAIDIEDKNNQGKKTESDQKVDAEFAAFFQSINLSTKVRIVESPVNTHFREAACYLMLSAVVARSRHGIPGKGDHFNQAFREKVS